MCAPCQREETSLEDGASEGRWAVEGESATQASRPRMAAGTGKECIDCPQVEEAELFAALDGAVEAFRTQNRRQVKERARHGGHRNAFAEVSVGLDEGRVVESEIGPGMATTNGDGGIE